MGPSHEGGRTLGGYGGFGAAGAGSSGGLYGGNQGAGDFGREAMRGNSGQLGGGLDDHYSAYRESFLAQCDRDYAEYRRERFASDFGAWRAMRESGR